ncbi:uncharacterized protein MELLADRAFT_71490 [Melampsora larici-populina 98AG31]|uniref:Uncharacterized protein n=1 Tax=Melampsora larici-populina (strain 98AG31 / pathotype 3-4-7) TaxID=747676 RepID=F4RGS6_MELLP|nr:uncharacterized protein MELLADRAFT_71490 [Melampsora larici-populina 98AG31]EGG08190.1 hypothetical protein MELLADRAFT_71490 [Melampsora larici-populina 98AG31]
MIETDQPPIPDVNHGDGEEDIKVTVKDDQELELEHGTPTNNLDLMGTDLIENEKKVCLKDTNVQVNDQEGFGRGRPTLEIQC